MKKLMTLHVQGKKHNWTFYFEGDPKDLKAWEEDGLERQLVQNTIPESALLPYWATKTWAVLQDLWNFKCR